MTSVNKRQFQQNTQPFMRNMKKNSKLTKADLIININAIILFHINAIILFHFSVTTNIVSDMSTDGANEFWNLPKTRLCIVLGCIAALILVALMQAGCTIYRASSRYKAKHKVTSLWMRMLLLVPLPALWASTFINNFRSISSCRSYQVVVLKIDVFLSRKRVQFYVYS